MSEVENLPADAGEQVNPAPEYSKEEKAYLDSRGGEVEQPKLQLEEPDEAQKEEQQPEPVKEGKVDYGALKEERTKRQALEKQLQDEAVLRARMEERWRILQEANRPQQQQSAPPEPDTDIFGAVKHDRQVIQSVTNKLSQWENQQRQQAQMAQLNNWAAAQEKAFKQDKPDYDGALEYLRQSRLEEMKDAGLDGQQAVAALQMEELQLIVQSARQQKNPAELAYSIAKRRGFQAPKPQEDLSKKLDVIEAGQQQSKSLSGVGGKAGGGEPSLADIAKMSDDDFEAWKTKNPAKWRRARGAA